MTRAYDDKTSTCGTCVYWQRDSVQAERPSVDTGHCNWISVPGWLTKPHAPLEHGIMPHMTRMLEDGGANCWLHKTREQHDRELRAIPSGE